MSDKPKVFFLDTNVLVDNPDSIYEFGRNPDNKVVITDIVLAELDELKRKDFASVNARRVSAKFMRLSDQEIDEYDGVIERGDLMRGVHLGIKIRDSSGNKHYEKGGVLVLYSDYRKKKTRLAFAPEIGQADLDIVSACKTYAETHKDEEVVLVTGDKNMVVVGRANGIKAEHREGENLSTDNLYKGYELVHNDGLYTALISTAKNHKDRHLSLNSIDEAWAHQLVGNQYIIFADEKIQMAIKEGKRINTDNLFRYDPVARALRGIAYHFNYPLGDIKPQNMEQTIALDALLSDEIKLSVMLGIAGGGKTYLALAVALHKIIHRRHEGNRDAKIYVTKRDVTVGDEEYGFLPGELENKVLNQYHAIDMNWRKLVWEMKRGESLGLTLRDALEDPEPLIEIIPFGFLRGVTFGPHDITIVEEIQNIEPRGMKPILTRIGEGEVYCTGDIYQPDNPHVRVDYNGANYTVDRIVKTREPAFQKLLSTITMRHCERSQFAGWAAKYL